VATAPATGGFAPQGATPATGVALSGDVGWTMSARQSGERGAVADAHLQPPTLPNAPACGPHPELIHS
jgi:hypothetical protein